MFDSLLGAVTNNSGLLVGGGSAAIVLWVLKKVPNESICSVVETTFESLGKVMTLGLAKWKMTKSVWNKFWGDEKPNDNVPIATALDTNAEYLSILKTKLIDIQEEIDKYEDDYSEDNIALLTYLKNKKKEIKLEIKTFEIKTRQTI